MDDLRLQGRPYLRPSKAHQRTAPTHALKKSAMKSPAKRRRGHEGPTPSKPIRPLEGIEGFASPRRVTFSPYVARTPKRHRIDKAMDEEDDATEEEAEEVAATIRKQRRMRMRFVQVRRPSVGCRLTAWLRKWWSHKGTYKPLYSLEDEPPAHEPLTPLPNFSDEDRAYNFHLDQLLEAKQPALVAPVDDPLELDIPSRGAFAKLADAVQPKTQAAPTNGPLAVELPGLRRARRRTP
ncbi:hypothetical protein ACHHYP_08353 [Achlya hypogyna]|uniref:Uncharacterized protein n=1 Tax=Achlya hypogyna TaxID=1202772 RepID=A0A1V9ZKW3_ACHHY|nr:hypothetical protein ACHHYP_08353 [Achlya hypogyna]